MQATINEVAKLAGVSIATVSRVMHDAGYVSQANKDKVNKAVIELGYVPNTIARSLKERCSFTVGITASDLSVAFFPEVIKRIEEQLLPLGYATLVSSTFDQADTERIVLKQMLARRVDALVVNSTGSNEELLHSKQIPIVFYDRRPSNCKLPSVYMNKTKAMQIALEYLTNKGHKRIMLVTGSRDLNSNLDRYLGFLRFIAESGTAVNNYRYRFGRFTYDDGIKAVSDIAEMPREERPDSIISGSIAITAGIVAGCRKRGISIPDDIALVSSGNFMYPGASCCELTYLDDRSDVLSNELVSLLKKYFNGEKVPQDYEVSIEPILIEGSTA